MRSDLNCRSSELICWLTADWVTWLICAALVKLSVSARSQKTLRLSICMGEFKSKSATASTKRRAVGARGCFWRALTWGVARALPQAGMGRAFGPRHSERRASSTLSTGSDQFLHGLAVVQQVLRTAAVIGNRCRRINPKGAVARRQDVLRRLGARERAF